MSEEAPTAAAMTHYIVSSIVDDKEAVRVDEVPAEDGVVHIEVRVADGELGRVIGRRGRVAQSIRTVVRAAGSKDGTEIQLDFVD